MATMPIYPPPIDAGSGTAGFTLIEMLVVLTIIGLLAALLAPSMFRKPAFVTRERLTVDLEARLKQAADGARTSGRPVTLDLGKAELSFAPAIGATEAPVIYPDGSSNGGVILLAGRPLLDVAWLDASVQHAAH